MEIREATPDEHGLAGQITADAYREFFDPDGSDPDHDYIRRIADVADRAARTVVLVAIDDGEMIGNLTLELDDSVDPKDRPLDPGEAHIRMLGVVPWARTRGAGRALMRAAESRAREAGKTEITLNTTHLMTPAQRMYGSMGYERGPNKVLPDGFILLGYRKVLGADSD